MRDTPIYDQLLAEYADADPTPDSEPTQTDEAASVDVGDDEPANRTGGAS